MLSVALTGLWHRDVYKRQSWYNDEAACRRILAEFGLPGTSHIVNGHVPVQEKNGESPKMCIRDSAWCAR